MAERVFDRETLLDISVNVIPLVILAFFSALFLFASPFRLDFFSTVVTHFLTLFPLVLLAILTYFSAKAIAGAEEKKEAGAASRAAASNAEGEPNPVKDETAAAEDRESADDDEFSYTRQ